MSESLVLGFGDYRAQGKRLAEALRAPYREVEVHRFPDGESRLRLPIDLPKRVLVCRSLDRPNDKLVELVLASRTARDLGAREVVLVAPYLCYMRQDAAFRPGEAVSKRVIGTLLSGWFDALVTVDPHLHRIASLDQVIPGIPVLAPTAAPLMARFLKGHLDSPVLVGPDGESEQWVQTVAREVGLDWVVGHKVRRGDREVQVTLPSWPYKGRHVVLLDDVASTGHTLQSAVKGLVSTGAASVSVLVCHPLFLEDAVAGLRSRGVRQIWSTDSITHPSNAISLAPVLAEAIHRGRLAPDGATAPP